MIKLAVFTGENRTWREYRLWLTTDFASELNFPKTGVAKAFGWVSCTK